MKKRIIHILFAIVCISSCGNSAKQLKPFDYEEPSVMELSTPDTTSVSARKETSKEEEKSSTICRSSASHSSKSHDLDSYDNMRGFDPASEDDMEDNGMSRYMDNNDEEGWD